MANSIKIKRSSVAAKVPVTGDLELGELAINTYDGKLYLKKDNGTASIVTVNPGGGGSGDVVGPGSSTDNAITRFDGVTGLLIQNSTATLDDSGVVSVSGANISGLTVSSAVATDGSKNLVSVANTGTGDNVLATSPTLITPALGTPTALVGTNISGTASGLSIGGNAGTVTDGVYTTDTSTVTNTMLAGSIANNKLVNSAITINGTSTSLGGSISVGTVTSVTGTSPISSSGGAAPDISISAAGVSTSGYLSATDWNTFNNKGSVTNLTGPITSVGNATSIASQTGTGSTIVVDTSPVLVTPNLGTPSAGTLTNCTFPTLNQDTTGTAAKTNALNSATTVVNVSSSTAPTTGQVLTATSGTAATWQSPASGGVTTIGFGTTGLTPSAATGGVVTVAGTLAVANGGTGVTSSTGTGNAVLSAAPTLSGIVTQTGDSYSLYGPNSSWGAYLQIGGNGRQVSGALYPSVAATNGNIHLDAGSGNQMYLNYYSGGGVNFGNGANGVVATVNSAGSFSGAAGIGVGQTWQAVSRAKGTVYTNSTGKPIMVFITMQNTSNSTSTIQISGGVTRGQFNNYGSYGGGTFVVPDGSTYSYNGPPNLNQWSELR